MNEYLVGGVIFIEKHSGCFSSCGNVPGVEFGFCLILETLSDSMLLRNYFISKEVLPYEFYNIFYLKSLKRMRRKRRRLKSKVQLSSNNILIGDTYRSEYYDIALDLFVIDEDLFMNCLKEFCDQYKFLLVKSLQVTKDTTVCYFPKGLITPSSNPYTCD